MKIGFSANELGVLAGLLPALGNNRRQWHLELRDEEICLLRELAMDRQAVEGFDEAYELNAYGRSLQALIDVLEV